MHIVVRDLGGYCGCRLLGFGAIVGSNAVCWSGGFGGMGHFGTVPNDLLDEATARKLD